MVTESELSLRTSRGMAGDQRSDGAPRPAEYHGASVLSYGVPEGLISSFPVRSAGGRWEIVQGLEIDEFSRGRIDASVAELVEERDAVQGMGLLG